MKTRKALVYCERDPNNHNHEHCLTKPQHDAPSVQSHTPTQAVCIETNKSLEYVRRAVNSHEQLIALLKQEHQSVASDLTSKVHVEGFDKRCWVCKAIAKAEGK